MTLAANSIIDILPLEIIDNTIDIIAADDRETDPFTLPNVKACSLTCHAFLPRSKPHIFRSINIEDTSERYGRVSHIRETLPLAKSFAMLLRSSPGISDLVRELHYIVPEAQGGFLLLVPGIFQTLVRLEKFVLSAQKGCTLEWWILSWSSRNMFSRLMELPSISHLRLESVTQFPPTLLFRCPNLQTLHLDRVTFDEDDVYEAPPASVSDSIKLKTLELKLEYSTTMTTMLSKIAKKITQNGEPVFDLTSLRNFTLEIDTPITVNLISKFLKRARNVESILLLVKPYYTYWQESSNRQLEVTMDQIIYLLIPSFQTLKCLTLHVIADAPQWQLLEQISRALNGIAVQAIWVSRLTIQISVERNIAFPEFLYQNEIRLPKKGSEWDLFERALLTPGHWPALKRVELEIFSGDDCSGSWAKEFSDFIRMWWNSVLRRAKVGIQFDFFASGPLKENAEYYDWDEL